MYPIGLIANGALSIFGFYVCYNLIGSYIPIFIQRKMFGRDQCKVSRDPVPEPMGVICAAVYLIVMFMFIPTPFLPWIIGNEINFPYSCLLAFLSGLLSICTAILLGFADDVLDLKWRHKLLFPTLSSLPLLMVYYLSGNSTTIVIPGVARFMFSQLVPYNIYQLPPIIDISFLYYVFMGMVVIFCTNAINIVAGINGIECGQSIVVGASIATFNLVQLYRLNLNSWEHHLSLYILLPFIGTSAALYYYNKYPAKVFVGDTYCYWAGMTLAVVSILGHFSKTLILFLIPQAFNFIYSVPQLFHWVPCPRHRLPRYDPSADKLNMSTVEFKESDVKLFGKIALALFNSVGLLYRRNFMNDGEKWVEINNLTILNLALLWRGPLHEKELTHTLLLTQFLFSLMAFFIRFYLAGMFYEVVQ